MSERSADKPLRVTVPPHPKRPLGPPDQCAKIVRIGPYAGQRCMLRDGHAGMCA